MRIGVIGSRGFNDYELMKRVLKIFEPSHIVSGGARGADKLAERYARDNNIPTTIHLPDWDQHGNAAGFIRNKDIVKDSEMVVAFWDQKSKGTLSSINIAREKKKFVHIVKF